MFLKITQIPILLIFIIIHIIHHYKVHNYLLLILDNYGSYLLDFSVYYLQYIFFEKFEELLKN